MLKKWFQSLPVADPPPASGGRHNNSADEAPALAERFKEVDPRREPPVALGKFASFDEIYRNAPVKPPKAAYGILKVAEMVNSSHLSGMSPEAKRCSLLMALE